MFERFFGGAKSPESGERLIQKVIGRELSKGVNGVTLYLAFEAAQEENRSKNLGLTNNHMLNLTRDIAIGMSGAIEDSMYGGREQTIANINAEIEKFRSSLSDEERRG